MKIKVVQLINTLKVGGAETLIKDYALMIDKNKFDISIIVTGGKFNTINEKVLEDNCIDIHYLGEQPGVINYSNSKFAKMYNLLMKQFVLVKLLRRINPDVIHAHLETAVYLTFYNSKKTKIFYTFHNEIEKMFNKNKLFKLSILMLIKCKGAIPIALHNKMAMDINQVFKIDNSIIISNGINLDRFFQVRINKNEIKRLMRLELEIPFDAYVIGHVGRFVYQKNHEFLIEVFKNTKKRIPNTYLLLIGEGELKQKIQEKLESNNLIQNVVFLENRRDIPEIMACMDTFVFPSRFEGFGNVLIEAQSVGIKCVMSDVIPKETIVNKETLVLSLHESVDTWVDSILDKSKTSKTYNTFDDLDIRKSIKQLEKLYENI